MTYQEEAREFMNILWEPGNLTKFIAMAKVNQNR